MVECVFEKEVDCHMQISVGPQDMTCIACQIAKLRHDYDRVKNPE